MTTQQAEFAARIARIEAGGGHRRSTIFVGPDEVFQFVGGPRVVRRAGLATTLGNILYPFTLVLCVAIGVLALAIGRCLQFHLVTFDVSGGNADIKLMIDIGAGLLIAMGFGMLDRMWLPDQVISRLTGVVLGALGLHNLVHMYPQIFDRLFSESWVSGILASTEAQSLLWRGVSYTFGTI